MTNCVITVILLFSRCTVKRVLFDVAYLRHSLNLVLSRHRN